MNVQYDFVRIREQVKNTSRPTMKLPVLCLAVLSSTLAVPNGYYHQEYNYKTSSSSFKNNELQHKTDDQGYFKKDGDLDGQTKPRVDANSEHTEYVNPNLRNSQYGSQYTGGYGSDSDLSSSGVMRATNDYSGYDTNSLAVDGLARSDRLVGSRGYSSGYSSGYGSNSYGSSSSTSASNIRVLTSRLQQDLENDLREAIRVNNMYAQSRVNMVQLEDELRRNLTERLNSELVTRYGQQMIRNGMSYSLDGGRLHSTANYNNQELNDLKNQVENSLLDQLRTQYHSSSSSSNQYYSQQNQQGTYGYSTTVRPSYLRIYPSLPANDNSRPVYQTMNSDYQTVNTNTRYTPVIHPESLTSIASRVQNEMDQKLNQLLDETKRKYFSSGSTYYSTNTDVLLERLRNELRSNLTYLLDENIRRNYGTQQLKNGYMYSLGSSGQVSSEYNYALSDLENLKAQVERNLINKLNRDIESYKTSWSSQQSYSSQSSYGNSYAYSSTPQNYEVYTTPRSSIYSLYTSPPTHGSNYANNGGYNYQEGSRSSGYEAQSSGYGVQSSGNIAQLQQNLQQQLSRQLQAAINKEQHSTYSTSVNGYSPSNYQSSLQELSNELNRNLTRNLQEYSASGSYAAYGNFDSAQMERLRTQLQESLMNQLRQGLQRSFESHNSYSGSSSSNYRSVRGFQNQQQNIAGEDCDGYHGYRAKRSHRTHTHYTGYEKNREEFGQVELGQNLESSDLQQQQLEEVGQQIEDFNSNQPAENVGYGRFSVYNQNQEPLETGQQLEDENYTGHRNLLLPNQKPLKQQADLTQKIEYSGYGKLQSQSQYQSPIEAGQQIEDDESSTHGYLLLPNQELIGQQTDLTQRVEDSGYGKLQLQSQYRSPIEAGQQIEDDDSSKHGNLLLPNPELIGQQADLTQQMENTGQQIEDDDSTRYGNLLLPNQEPIGQQTDLTQRVEDSGYGKLQSQSQYQSPIEAGQQIEDDDSTRYGNLLLPNQEPIGQQTDLTQRVEDSGYRKLQSQSQYQSPIEAGQQIEDDESSNHGILLLPNRELIGQQTDLTQRVEDSGYGKLQLQSQYRSPIEAGQQIEDGDSSKHGNLLLPNPELIGKQADLTQQMENTGQQIEDDDSTRYGNLLLPNQEPIGQQTDLTQRVEDSGYGKLQSQSQYQSHIEAGQQIEDDDSTRYGNLLLPNQEPIGQQTDLTQRVEDSGYGKLQSQSQYQSPIEAGQQIEDDESSNHGNLLLPNRELIGQQTDLTQRVEDSGYGKLQLQSQYRSPIEAGQQIEDDESSNNGNLLLHNQELIGQQTDLTQRVEDSGLGKLPFQSHYRSPNEAGHQVEDENTDIGKLLLPNQEQQSDIQENEHVIEVEQVEEGVNKSKITKSEPIGQQSDDLIITQQMEESHTTQVPQKQVDQQTGDHRDCQHVGKSVDQIEDNYSVSLIEPKPCDIQHVIYVTSWCDKYVDTSYMDAPWSLGEEMKENISRIISQNDGITADSSNILEKVLAGIPKEMLEKCFEVEKIELKYQGTVLAGLNEYLKTLIKNQIDEALKKNIQNQGNKQVILPANHNEITINQEQPKTPIEVSNNSDAWCSQYVAISVTNTAWSISKNLKNDIAKKVSQGDDPKVTYKKVLSEIPDEMLSKCFRIDTIESSEQKIVLAGIEDYFQSLIRKEIDVTIKNQKNVENSARPNNQLSNQDPVSTQTIAQAEQVGDSLIDALSKHTHNRPSVVQEAPLYESSNPQSGTIGSHYHGNYGNNRGIDAPSGNDMMYVHRFDTRYENNNPPYRNFGSYDNQLVNPYPNVPGPHGYHSQIPQSRVAEQNLEPIYADHRYLHSYNHYQNQFGGRYEQFDEGAFKVQHRPVYSGIKGRRVQRPHLIHKPVQELIQEIPVQEVVQQPVHKSVQEPIITPIVVAPSESGNLDGKPERIVEPEQTEVSTEAPEELSWWKRFGNKVKQGAQNLKEKIIG